MRVFMVTYRHNGLGQRGVVANSEKEAMVKFDKWRQEQVNKEYLSEAIRAYEIELIK